MIGDGADDSRQGLCLTQSNAYAKICNGPVCSGMRVWRTRSSLQNQSSNVDQGPMLAVRMDPINRYNGNLTLCNRAC